MRLKYEKYNGSENAVVIDLHNGYSVIAVSGLNIEKQVYTTTLFLKENSISDWKLIEEAECLEFATTRNSINSAILKQVSTYLEEGFFDYYINRYEYEMKCFNRGNDLYEKERLNDASQF